MVLSTRKELSSPYYLPLEVVNSNIMRNKRYALTQAIYDKESRTWKIISVVLDWETLQFSARMTRCDICNDRIHLGFKNREGKTVYCIAGGREDDLCDFFTSSCQLPE